MTSPSLSTDDRELVEEAEAWQSTDFDDDVMAALDAAVSLITRLAARLRAMGDRGTVSHRFSSLLDELAKRFPDEAKPFAADPPELRYLAAIDRTVSTLRAMGEERDAWRIATARCQFPGAGLWSPDPEQFAIGQAKAFLAQVDARNMAEAKLAALSASPVPHPDSLRDIGEGERIVECPECDGSGCDECAQTGNVRELIRWLNNPPHYASPASEQERAAFHERLANAPEETPPSDGYEWLGGADPPLVATIAPLLRAAQLMRSQTGCKDYHHTPKQYHDHDEPCPVERELDAAINAAIHSQPPGK